MAFAWTWKAIKFVGEWTLGIDGLEDFKKNWTSSSGPP